MIKSIIPKLPMRNSKATRDYFITGLGFELMNEYPGYLIIKRDDLELHFFLFADLDPSENYGQIYFRVDNIEGLYKQYKENNIKIHDHGELQLKPWGQNEFSLLDPDNNLLTFGEAVSKL